MYDEPEHSRYGAYLGARRVGVADYRVDGKRVLLTHVGVEGALEGRGIGSALVEYVVADIESSGRSVVPVCPFVRAWLARRG